MTVIKKTFEIMKKTILIIILSLASSYKGQVAIGKTAVNGSSTILDFKDTDNWFGIILPAVDQAPTTSMENNNGTFLFDKTDQKVKMYENDKWVELSHAKGNGSSIVNNATAEVGTGAIIGASTTSAKGVLVLESADKAVILPKIFRPDINVRSPYPGMICYDTFNKMIAVFDGKVWNFWK